MTPKAKAEQLVNSFKVILMDEDTDCGHEILCTSIAKKCALICVEELIDYTIYVDNFLEDVKTEIIHI